MNAFLKWVFLIYFVSHIPITLSIDLQALFGSYYPQVLRDVFQWYVVKFNDVVMANPQPWLKSFIYAELFFQLPFFFVVTYGIIFKKNWIRIPSIVYGAHVSTTVFPILLEVAMSSKMSFDEKMTLIPIYSPYLIIPATLTLYMCFVPLPFGDEIKIKRG